MQLARANTPAAAMLAPGAVADASIAAVGNRWLATAGWVGAIALGLILALAGVAARRRWVAQDARGGMSLLAGARSRALPRARSQVDPLDDRTLYHAQAIPGAR